MSYQLDPFSSIGPSLDCFLVEGSVRDLGIGLNLVAGTTDSTVISAHQGDRLLSFSPSLEGMNFRDMSVVHALEPPTGFIWQFLGGVWALVPKSVPSNVPDVVAGIISTDGLLGGEGNNNRSSDHLSPNTDGLLGGEDTDY